MTSLRSTILMRKSFGVASVSWSLAWAVVTAACAAQPERFEPASLTCDGEPCSDLAGGGVGNIAAPGSVGVDDAGSVDPTINSAVAEFVELEVQGAFSMDFAVRQPLNAGQVQVYPAASAAVAVAAGVVSLELTQATRGVWVLPPEGAELRTTLNVFDVSQGLLSGVLAINEGTLLDLTDSLALDTRELAVEASAAFVFFADAAGRPLTGVSLQQSLGATVAYDLGIIYSDAIEATMERGVAVLLHLDATAEVPEAQMAEFQAVSAGEQYEVSIPVARGATTLATVTLGETGP